MRKSFLNKCAGALLLVLWITGCIPRYENLASGPSATLAFQFPSGFEGLITRAGIAEAESCLGLKLHRGKDPAIVPVGKPLFIVQGWEGVTGGGCKISYSFTPIEGEKYISEFITRRNQCELKLMRMLPNGSTVSEASATKWSRPYCVNM